MDEYLLEQLKRITEEEQEILGGRISIDRNLYMQGKDNMINSRKLLEAGKLITIRPHTRFIHFPEHTHDYVEMVYMCAGTTTHIVNGKSILLEQGALLFIGQSTTHEVCRAKETDIAVNFIVLPDFFSTSLTAIGEEETPLRRFLVDCLCGEVSDPGYLHFDVSNIKPVQNLIENLLWILIQDTQQKRKVSQMTMALLFLQLMNHTDALLTGDYEEAAVFRALQYIETHYAAGSFSELTELLHYDPSWLSRQIKEKTGKTYTRLIQERRLAQAAFLLKNTNKNVSDISVAVGYENISYFHRIFAAEYGRSPKYYRDD